MTVNRKAQRILELAMKINNIPTKREVTGNKPTVFVWFSGHVNLLNVEIHSNGWVEKSVPDYVHQIYLSDESADDMLNECISVLKNIWQKYRPVHTEELTQDEEVAE
ncbi:MAG: hypothetical protein UD936_01975 [Acutalibacteraceae bacterium]|nr:hypothetical protein [Acutalibacteraceae bacterium]